MSFEEKLFGGPYRKSTPEVINESVTDSQGGSGYRERDPLQDSSTSQLCAGFDEIIRGMKQNPEALTANIERLRSLPDCDGILKKFEPYFTDEHWEMIVALEAYDQATFDHSLRVAAFVYDMTSGGGVTEQYLKQRIGAEEGTLEELYTAALFHDIGKTAIPREILHDNHSRREWARRANEWALKNKQDQPFDPAKIEILGDVQLDDYFMQLHAIDGMDPLNIVPIEEIFSPEIIQELERHDISPHDTFRKVLECHERATGAILLSKKMLIASDIASHHHDYDRKPIRSEHYPTEISAIRLGFELSILRSMDVYDALISNDRSYKKPFHPLIALEIIIKEAQTEFIELELTKYVVRDLYEKARREEDFSLFPAESTKAKALTKILDFIQA